MAATGDAAAQSSAQAPPGLLYVSDDAPGFRRIRRGKAFSYRQPDGEPLRDAAHIERIRKLAIPPAYTDVWICMRPNGHLQATGRDARGRKQYRYHPDWRVARDADKFDRMRAFGAALPRIRARVAKDLAQASSRAPSRDVVLATLVRLLDTTLVRVGNDEYARSNGSFGLTTLRNRHAQVQGSTLTLRFKGKSGVVHDVSVEDPRVARVVRRCQAMPGQELFSYVDEVGECHGVGSADVNAYLREASGAEFTAKDFRTWHATALALALVSALEGEGAAAANQVLAAVAQRLGNTASVCRKSYVHPGVLQLAAQGLEARAASSSKLKPKTSGRGARGLDASERALLAFLAV